MDQFMKPWTFLFMAAGLITAWFGGQAAYKLWEYSRLDSHAAATIKDWRVRQKGSSYLIQAAYTYQVKGIDYRGKSTFEKPVYLNRDSAEADIEKWAHLQWQVWVDTKNPARSTFQKMFPYKSSIYGLISLSVLIYFYFLKLKASPKKSEA